MRGAHAVHSTPCFWQCCARPAAQRPRCQCPILEHEASSGPLRSLQVLASILNALGHHAVLKVGVTSTQRMGQEHVHLRHGRPVPRRSSRCHARGNSHHQRPPHLHGRCCAPTPALSATHPSRPGPACAVPLRAWVLGGPVAWQGVGQVLQDAGDGVHHVVQPRPGPRSAARRGARDGLQRLGGGAAVTRSGPTPARQDVEQYVVWRRDGESGRHTREADQKSRGPGCPRSSAAVQLIPRSRPSAALIGRARPARTVWGAGLPSHDAQRRSRSSRADSPS